MPETTRPGRCPACGKTVVIHTEPTPYSVWSFARCLTCRASDAQLGSRLLRWECEPVEGIWDDGHAPVETAR